MFFLPALIDEFFSFAAFRKRKTKQAKPKAYMACLFILTAALFSFPAFSMTAIEAGAAAGAAAALQSAPSFNPKKTLDNVKSAVQNYEKIQAKRLKGLRRGPAAAAEGSSAGKERNSSPGAKGGDFDSSPAPLSSLKDIPKEELEARLKDEEIYSEIKPADYQSSVQIFYKNPSCRPDSRPCSRGAVLTNIKSVIFDYAHARGSFSKLKRE